jgi:hypothetical protein
MFCNTAVPTAVGTEFIYKKNHLKKISQNVAGTVFIYKKILPQHRSRNAAGTEFISKNIHLKKFSQNRSRSAAGTFLRSPLPTPLPLPPSKPYQSSRPRRAYLLLRSQRRGDQICHVAL